MQILLNLLSLVAAILFFSLVFKANFVQLNRSDAVATCLFAIVAGAVIALGLTQVSDVSWIYMMIFGLIGGVLSVLLVYFFRFIAKIVFGIA